MTHECGPGGDIREKAPFTFLGKPVYFTGEKGSDISLQNIDGQLTIVVNKTSMAPDCNVELIYDHEPPTPTEELGCKLAAKILLSKAGSRRVVVPSDEEWWGVGFLERDGELP